jgi:hypothetical protein
MATVKADVAARPDAERVGRNDATFRAANERIEKSALAFEFGAERIPFICECADERCTTVIGLTFDEYESIRAVPTHFLNAPGHHVAGGPHVRVVEDRGRYAVVEKLGEAARIVAELDPRRR